MRRVLVFLIFLTFFSSAVAQESEIFPVSIETDLLNPDIPPDEIQNYSILITPTSGRVEDIRLSVLGLIARFISLEKNSISLDFGETQEIGIELSTVGAKVGTYSGFLIVEVNDRVREIPVRLEVIEKEANIDLTVEVKTEEVKLPEPIKFLVTIYNVGQKERFDLHLSHKLNSVTGETRSEQEEDATLVTSLSFERSFLSVDLSLEEGTYYIETTAHYEGHNETSVSPFKFVEPFWTTTKIAVLVFVIIIAAFAVGFRSYKASQ